MAVDIQDSHISPQVHLVCLPLEVRLYADHLFHDMYTLKNTVFRRDEIWFAAENNAHESEIYALHEIRGEDNDRIKNTAAYDKQYPE